MTTEIVVDRQYVEEPARRREAEAESRLARERAERVRLQAAVNELEAEAYTLRPLKEKVEGLRAEAERVRLREAGLVQARDRALARLETLEIVNARLERERKELERRLAELSPPAEPEPRSHLPPAPLTLHGKAPLPAALLAGREVFFFTGEVRKSSAEAIAWSLRELGTTDIRTYRIQARKRAIDGPDLFPPGSLVVVDVRFMGHSQSGPILDRAARNGVEHLAVRSGKGSLARVVAAALPPSTPVSDGTVGPP